MRKLFNEFFYIPKHGKVREKVMLTRIAMTVTIVIMCLAAMSITAYAYFSYNISSGSNIIKAAHFETKVSIQITDENEEAVDINPITSNYQTYKVGLDAGKTYTVTITPTENSTAKTGFVVITANGCEKTYHTQQLGIDTNIGEGETKTISFKLIVTDKTDVHFLAHWGTSSYYDAYKNKGDQEELYITQGEEIMMIVNGYAEPNVSKNTNEGSNDENEGTEGTTPSTNTTGTETPTTQTPESTTTPSTETSTPVETTPPETTGESESTNTTEPSSTTTEPATQTTEPAATESASTESTTDTQSVTENSETTGTTTTEANE